MYLRKYQDESTNVSMVSVSLLAEQLGLCERREEGRRREVREEGGGRGGRRERREEGGGRGEGGEEGEERGGREEEGEEGER